MKFLLPKNILSLVLFVFQLVLTQTSWAIIGGTPETRSDISQAVVALSVYNHAYRPFCSGVYISENTILTAAHCAVGSYANYVLFNLQSAESNEIVSCKITKLIPYPDYQPGSDWYDLAIIKFSCDDSRIGNIKPIKINEDVEIKNKNYLSLGYGKKTIADKNLSFPELNSLPLNMVDVQIYINDTTIDSVRKEKDRLQDLYTYQQKGAIKCFASSASYAIFSGDSGGPLLVEDFVKQNSLSLVGLNTSGYTKQNAEVEDVTTLYSSCSVQLAPYLEWIQKN